MSAPPSKLPPYPITDDRIRPFRLVKYFTFISLIVLFVGTLALAALNTHWARRLELTKNEDYALLLIDNLNHQIFLQFVLPTIIKHGKIQLREREQFELMDRVVRTTLHGFKVDMVNIYDLGNTISYSLDPDRIGDKNAGGTNYNAALEGQRVTKIDQRGNFLQLLFGLPEESRLVTYAPLRAEKPLSRIPGPVLGVVELVQDLSDEYGRIYRVQGQVLLSCTLVMLILFLVLLFVVRKGENIIEQRAQERLRLKEQLAKARHLSTIGEMTAGISHEIRNPLGIIKSSAALLKKRMAVLDPDNGLPGIIEEEAGRLNNIITDFLNFARPREPIFQPCRLEEVMEKNLQALGPQIEARHYTVVKDFHPGLPIIQADADMLYQAFLNLLINAMQAMPDGGDIRIRITPSEDHLTIQILDQGPGILEDIMDKIWDPFFTNKKIGTGLGLGMVRNIIEAHGGSVTIANGPEAGAEATIRLPIAQES
jgi:two-component system sensor histidine kinase HydH